MVARELVKRGIITALIAWMSVTPVAAQDRMGAQAFLDRVADGTVSFYNVQTGTLVGVERFLGRDRVVWQPRGRDCVDGTVTVRNDMVCFQFPALGDTEPACWAVFQQGDSVVVVNQDRWRGQSHVLRFEGRGQTC